ncbi:MAG: 30S ribosomal protein S8 [Actinobacteria bacterium]|nr:30S ribosomal protein S8 [Actinomycetota bacterium]
MMLTDPIADMLTRIKNANKARHKSVEMPSSKMKVEIAKILKKEGYIEDYEVIASKPVDILKINLRYLPDKRQVIHGIRRISKPGLRVYVKKDEIPKVLGGLGIAIISTSKGLMTDYEARKNGLGGEVICYVW